MKKRLGTLIFLLSTNAFAVNSFDVTTNTLKLDNVVVGDTQYNNVEVNLKSFEVLKVGTSGPYGAIAELCAAGSITVEHYNAITQGMSLQQVKQLIGCNFNPTLTISSGEEILHTWVFDTKLITVIFNATTEIVVNKSVFKIRTGF